MIKRLSSGKPVQAARDVAVLAGGTVLAVAMVGAVLLFIGATLVLAGVVALGAAALAAASAPVVLARGRRAGLELRAETEAQAIDVPATARPVDAGRPAERTRRVLGRVARGETSPEDALDELG